MPMAASPVVLATCSARPARRRSCRSCPRRSCSTTSSMTRPRSLSPPIESTRTNWPARALEPARDPTIHAHAGPLSSLFDFVIRTHASPFWRSRPSPALIAAALAGVAAAILLPCTPLAAPLGFTPLPASYPPIVATLVVAYPALVEATKRALFTPGDLLRPAPPPTTPAVRHVHRRAARFTTTARRRHPAHPTDLRLGQQRGPGSARGATARLRRAHSGRHGRRTPRRIGPGSTTGHGGGSSSAG